MKIFISLSNEQVKATQTFGTLQLVGSYTNKNLYTCTWANKMKNSTTTLTKLEPKQYSVRIIGTNVPETAMQFKDLKSASLGFFSNCSTVRLEDTQIMKARKWMADWIKNIEGVSSLAIKLDIRSRERDNLHIPVSVGRTNAERRGILLSITEMSDKCRVMMLNDDGSQGNVLELPKDQIWID